MFVKDNKEPRDTPGFFACRLQVLTVIMRLYFGSARRFTFQVLGVMENDSIVRSGRDISRCSRPPGVRWAAVIPQTVNRPEVGSLWVAFVL